MRTSETETVSFDAISISCICEYFYMLTVHATIAVLHGRSFSPVSLCLIVSQWLKQCESISLDYCYLFVHSTTLVDWFVLVWGLVGRRLFSFDAIKSCICDYFGMLTVHPALAVLHGRSFSPVSLCLIVSQWLKQCESIIILYLSCFLSLCVTHILCNFDAGFDLPSFRSRGDFYVHFFVHH